MNILPHYIFKKQKSTLRTYNTRKKEKEKKELHSSSLNFTSVTKELLYVLGARI